MSSPDPTEQAETATRIGPLRCLVAVRPSYRSAAIEECRTVLEGVCSIAAIETESLATAGRADDPGGAIALLVLDAEQTSGPIDLDATIAEADRGELCADAAVLILTDRERHDDLTTTLDRDRLHALFGLPWTPGALGQHARAQVARWLRARSPDDPRLDLLDAGGRSVELPTSELLRDLELDDEAVTDRLVRGLERALGPRPRLSVGAGTRLTREGDSVDAVFVLLRGSVALERQTRVGALRMHHVSTGPVIGLLSLTQQRQAYFTARTTTPAELLHVSLEQLDRALRLEPDVGGAVAAIAISGLAGRLLRSEQLQIQRIELNRDLEVERQRLAAALSELEAARVELLQQTRMATLGELAAGVAHELNNPVAALGRAASFVRQDLEHLLAGHPRGEPLSDALAGSHDRVPAGTAEERASRRRLAEAIEDPELARLMVAAGIVDPDQVPRFAAIVTPEDREELEAAIGAGTALRNLEVAAMRIAELVNSLRSYARPGSEPVAGVELHEVVEDALRLVAHRLEGIDLRRVYEPVPPLYAHPGELGQVVTNLVVNAAEAAGPGGSITVETNLEHEQAVLRVIDTGPGIDAADLQRLFEPRFTTKHGVVRYGLGYGLTIAQRIVTAHGGSIELTSEPGRTIAEVHLPIREPAEVERSRKMPQDG